MKLIKTQVEQLNSPGYYWDSEIPGLCLRVSVAAKSGRITKAYLINTRLHGSRKSVSITIGKHGSITSEKARRDARVLLGLISQGINPNEQRRKEIAAIVIQEDELELGQQLRRITLEQVLVDYIDAHDLKQKTKTDYVRFIRRCLKDWLALPIISVTKDMVQKRHLELSTDHPAQANYTMRILRALFKYAMAVYEQPDGRPLLSGNPVERLRDARLWNRNVRRQTVIRPHQLAAWYQGVKSLANAEARDILLLELLTGFRHGEAISLRWKDIDFDAKVITLEDTKNREDHMFPMSTQLEDMLKARFQCRKSFEFVFPSGITDGHVADIRDSIAQVVSHSGVRFTEHDLRRTFETTAESLDISYYSLKRLLNHKTGNDPTAGYIVSTAERLRQASQKIADYLEKQMEAVEASETVAPAVRDVEGVCPVGEQSNLVRKVRAAKKR